MYLLKSLFNLFSDEGVFFCITKSLNIVCKTSHVAVYNFKITNCGAKLITLSNIYIIEILI